MNYRNRRDGKLTLISGDQPRFDGNTFSVRTDPGAQASKLPEPIPLLGPECAYVDVRYEGNANLADNTVVVAAMDQDGSEWRKIDSMNMQVVYHYLGLGMSENDHNNAFNRQFRITQEQAISAAYASQMTDLEFMGQLIQSDIPEMDGIVDVVNAIKNDGAYFTGSGQFALLVWYQAFLQNMALIMAKYNTLMSFNDYLLQMGYNAESALTLRFMNLMKKQNVWTVFDQLGNILNSQFFDLDYYQEITSMNAVPCRKRNEVGSPLITITGTVAMPQICVYPSNAKQKMFVEWRKGQYLTGSDLVNWTHRAKAALEDGSEDVDKGWVPPVIFTVDPPAGSESWLLWYNSTSNPTSVGSARAAQLDAKRARYMVTIDGKTMTVEELTKKICDFLSPHSILKWSRERYFNPLQYANDDDPANARSKKLINLVGNMVDVTSHFRSDTVDLLTFLKVIQNSTSMNHWVLDTPYLHPALPRVQVRPTYFKLIYDILTSYGTSGDMVLDDNTKGWDIFTWWHATEGVPKYDVYDGGFTIAASVRSVPANDSGVYDTPEYMIPRLFEVVEGSIKLLSRRGREFSLTSEELDETEIAGSSVFAGAALVNVPASIKIPVLNFSSIEGVDNKDYSQAVRCLNSMFGVGKIILSDGTTSYEFMDPEMEGFIGRTFPNANSMALTYINGRAPFRTSSTNGGLGFTIR